MTRLISLVAQTGVHMESQSGIQMLDPRIWGRFEADVQTPKAQASSWTTAPAARVPDSASRAAVAPTW